MKHIFILFTLLFSNAIYAQVTNVENQVRSYLEDSYISDGQIYRVMLNYEEEGEFDVTLFGGTQYRIAFSSTLSQANLIFTVIDFEQNVLFTNQDFDNTPYWDLLFTSTIDCKIQVKIEDKQNRSGIAVIMIGYK
ncbi:MAG: hypothetical protein PHU27_07270 [Salinivirgaceae bacterium]|nr:hypothetical protein [Salinivirgaceae bacterium]MDD4746496.1 hypothetical protein [Salinivirgaceae bacterium]